MHLGDIGPDAYLRLGNFNEGSDLSRMVHPELHNSDVWSVSQFEQRERQADVVIVISRVAEDVVAKS